MAFDPITAGFEFGKTIIDAIVSRIPDPNERERTRAALEAAQQAAANAVVQGQIDTNKVEAASASVFVAGWRPAVGWCCVATLAWNYTVAPVLTWGLDVCGVTVPPMPTLDSIMAQTLFGILGLNIGARTVEKVQEVARGTLNPTQAARR